MLTLLHARPYINPSVWGGPFDGTVRATVPPSGAAEVPTSSPLASLFLLLSSLVQPLRRFPTLITPLPCYEVLVISSATPSPKRTFAARHRCGSLAAFFPPCFFSVVFRPRRSCRRATFLSPRAPLGARFPVFRSADVIQNKTETEKKLDEALSSKNWGASSTLLNDIAKLTFSLCVPAWRRRPRCRCLLTGCSPYVKRCL